MNDKTPWEVLSQIDVNEHTENKGGFTYLSWAWAWATLKHHYPEATFTKHYFDLGGLELPYTKTPEGHAFVRVTVTIGSHEMTETMPVLDHRNKPIEHPSSFEVNTALQRCLAKCIAFHGLGAYIYAGEDLPYTDEVGDFASDVLQAIENEDFMFIGRTNANPEFRELWMKVNNKTSKTGGYLTSNVKSKVIPAMVDMYLDWIDGFVNQFNESIAGGDNHGAEEILTGFEDKTDKIMFAHRVDPAAKAYLKDRAA